MRYTCPMNARTLTLVGVVLASCGSSDRCSTARYGGEVCAPDGGMAAETPLRIWVLESTCGSPCDRTGPSCEVVREGSVLTLTLERISCPMTEFPNTVCIAVCVPTGAFCALPPLAAGEYTLRSDGHPDVGLSTGTGPASSCPEQSQRE